MRSLQPHLPMLVGVNGREALAHAARHADIIGLMMLGKTLPDGQRHEVRWEPGRLDDTVEWIRTNATEADVELNALVQVARVTDDRAGAIREVVSQIPSVSAQDAAVTPFLAIGTVDEIVEHMLECRRRWGISYFTLRAIEPMAPVIERLRAIDATDVRLGATSSPDQSGTTGRSSSSTR